ncbi:MAG: hypothetical protein AAB696_01765 [Patescibacteria group bacterium]
MENKKMGSEKNEAEGATESTEIDKCPYCKTFLSDNGTCESLSCEKYGEKFINSSELAAYKKTPKKEIDNYQEKIKTEKDATEDEQFAINSFLNDLNFYLENFALNTKSSEADIKEFLSKTDKHTLKKISLKIESLLEFQLHDADYYKKSEFIEKLNRQLVESPIMELLVKINNKEFKKGIKISSEKEKEEKLKFIGISLPVEILNKLKFRAKNADIRSEIKKTLENKINKENIVLYEDIEYLLLKLVPEYIHSSIAQKGIVLNIRQKQRLDELLNKKEFGGKTKELIMNIELKKADITEESYLIGAIIRLFPEIAEEILEEHIIARF